MVSEIRWTGRQPFGWRAVGRAGKLQPPGASSHWGRPGNS